MSFSTFPRVAHLPGSHADCDDIIEDASAAARFLARPAWVFEKLDGLNVMVRHGGQGRLEVSLKPDWQGVLDGAVERALAIWFGQREAAITKALPPRACFYGEWLWHRVSVPYTALTDLFVVFGARDRDGRLLPFARARSLAQRADLQPATPLLPEQQRLGNVDAVRRLVGRSRLGPARMEGIILEGRGAEHERYLKWVDAAYVHPVKGVLSGERNRLARQLSR